MKWPLIFLMAVVLAVNSTGCGVMLQNKPGIPIPLTSYQLQSWDCTDLPNDYIQGNLKSVATALVALKPFLGLQDELVPTVKAEASFEYVGVVLNILNTYFGAGVPVRALANGVLHFGCAEIGRQAEPPVVTTE